MTCSSNFASCEPQKSPIIQHMHISSYFHQSLHYFPSVSPGSPVIIFYYCHYWTRLHTKNMSFIFTVISFSVHLFSSGPLPVSISLICHVELDCRSTQGLVRLEKDRRSAGHSLHETPRLRPTKVIVTEVEVSMNFENEKCPHLFSSSWFNFIHSIVNWS